MKNLIKIILILSVILIASCSKKIEKVKVISEVDKVMLDCCPDGGGLLPSPINIGPKSSVVANDTMYKYYEAIAKPTEQYKDHSPFVEIDKNDPFQERLWFTTSREFKSIEQDILTDLPQQLYYSTRTVAKDGICPSDGWSEPIQFKTNSEIFNQLVIGAVTISGDTMIASASHIETYAPNLKYNYFNDLYVLVRSEGTFLLKEPIDLQRNVIDSLCSDSTWESQPTLSADGNTIFFVSDRPLVKGGKPVDMNIFYSRKVNNKWISPKEFPFNSEFNEETPQISPDGRYLYFATNNPKYATKGGYDIVAVEFNFNINDEKSRNSIQFKGEPILAELTIATECNGKKTININDPTNQRYPHNYYNPANKYNSGKAMFWASDNPKGYGGYDIYGCAMPKNEIKLEVVVINALTNKLVSNSHNPFVELYDVESGKLNSIKLDEGKSAYNFNLDFNKVYAVKGGINGIDGEGKIEECNFCPDSTLQYYMIPDTKTVSLKRDSSITIKEEVREIPINLQTNPILPKKGDMFTTRKKVTEKYFNDSQTEIEIEETVKIVSEPIIVDSKIKASVEVKEVRYFTETYTYTPTLSDAKKLTPTKLFNGIPGNRNTSEFTKNKGISTINSNACTIYDTIYVIPECKEMQPCKFKFAEYWGSYNKRVPYFQTAYWKVNTYENFNSWAGRSKISEYYPQFTTPINELIPNAQEPPEGWEHWNGGAKWIELHPDNSYWSDPTDATASKRVGRIIEYQGYAKDVDKNLNNASKVLCGKLLPAYQIIYGVKPGGEPSKAKFIIYLEAWSDYRNVKRGWYLSDKEEENTIIYAAGSLEENATDPGFRLVKVKHGDALGKNNDVLSDLRAYFGYHELLKVLDTNDLFKKYLDSKEVLTPDMLVKDGKLIDDSEIKKLIENSKIIILAKGYSTVGINEGLIPGVNSYAGMKSKTDFFDLDTVRTLNIIAEPLYFLDGKFEKSDCCSPDKLEIADHDMNKKLEPYRTTSDVNPAMFVVSLGAYNTEKDAQTIKNFVDVETGLSAIVKEFKYHDGSKKYRIYYGTYNQDDAIKTQGIIKPLLTRKSLTSIEIPITVERYDIMEPRLNSDVGAGIIVLKNSTVPDYNFVTEQELNINKEISVKYAEIPKNSISERRKFYDSYLVGPTRVNLFKREISKNNFEYIYYIGPFEKEEDAKYCLDEFVKKHINSAKYVTELINK